MDDGRPPGEKLSFREARRKTVSPGGEIEGDRSRLRWFRGAARRWAVTGLGVALIVAMLAFLASIPRARRSPPAQPIRPVQLEPAPSPSPLAADDPDEKRGETPKRKRPRKKHKRIVIARADGSSSIETSAETTVTPIAKQQRDRSRDKKETSSQGARSEPTLPEATLLFRRLYKDRNGDHFHSVYADKIAAKEEAGYRVRETVGYLYEEQVRGTTLFTIGEGTMGWIYTEDQGKQTIPLYRLVGPDHHDNEVVFTSSEDVKTYWIGNGWREDRVVGYIVRP